MRKSKIPRRKNCEGRASLRLARTGRGAGVEPGPGRVVGSQAEWACRRAGQARPGRRDGVGAGQTPALGWVRSLGEPGWALQVEWAWAAGWALLRGSDSGHSLGTVSSSEAMAAALALCLNENTPYMCLWL